ncbi:MAG: tetratricopeptide repeat protein [Deltaproteobacteria bacterium]|nr:tetratricopeptide repeat protein [Deltaproteobacteria bacterium]
MILALILAAVFPLFLSSCETVEKEVKETVKESETPSALSIIRQWEEYMRFAATDGNPSLDTILKLTDQYFDAKDVVYKEMMDAYEKGFALYGKGRLDKEPQLPVRDYAELIRHFKPLTERRKGVKGWDGAFYALGYAYAEQGLKDESTEVFEELAGSYPASPYLIEVSFRLGEFYFDNAMYAEAIGAYSRILEHPNSGFYEKALYKLGWVYYKVDDIKKATDAFSEVMEMRRVERVGKGGLAEEATSGVVMCLGHFSDAGEAVRYLESKGLKEYMPMLLKMFAEVLTQQARYEAAIYVYTTLSDLFPDGRDLPAVYNQLADVYDKTGNSAEALKVRLSLLKKFNPQTSWYKENYPDREANVDGLVSEVMLSTSKIYHLKGKKEANADEILTAIEIYRLFLVSFPGSARYKEVNLLYAEALLDAGSYKESAIEYEKTAVLYPAGKERGEIANLAFLTYEMAFYQSAENREESLKGAVGAMDAFKDDLKRNAVHEKALYKLSDMYATAGDFGKARENIAPLLEGKGSLAAQKKTADFYLAEGNITEAENFYSKVVTMADDPSSRETLAKLRYKIAEDLLKDGRWEDALKKFEDAVSAMPGGKVAESSMVMIGRIYIEKKDMNRFESVLKRLEKAYPASQAEAALLVEAGKGIEKESSSKAGGFYERASFLVSKTDDSLKLLLAAGVLYEKDAQYDKAEGVFRRYADSKGASEEKGLEALFRLGSAQIKAGNKRVGLKTLKDLVESRGKAKGPFIAKAKLSLLNDNLDDYLKVELTQPFEETFKKKTELLNALLSGYSTLVDENVPGLLPEIFLSMGMAFENFRDSILGSERPGDLSKEELEEYNFLLEEKAYPYDEQAVGAYENGLKAGIAQKLYDDPVEKTIERLAVIRPALYRRRFEEDSLEPVYMHEPAQQAVAGGGGT